MKFHGVLSQDQIKLLIAMCWQATREQGPDSLGVLGQCAADLRNFQPIEQPKPAADVPITTDGLDEGENTDADALDVSDDVDDSPESPS